MRTFLAFLFLSFAGCSSSPISPNGVPGKENSPNHLSKPYVLVISIDGYRYDYTDRYHPSHLTRLRDEGASAKSLIPIFPSKTFPNHYTTVTGLYAENHGILANNFYDFSRPKNSQYYQLSNRSTVKDGSWYGGEPIWVTAEKNGMLSANYFWPGGEAAIQGVYPSYGLAYDQSVPLADRVEQVLEWLHLPETRRPHLLLLYMSEVDSAGHSFGHDSPEVKVAVSQVDQAIGTLMEGIRATGLPVNVIVTSDHGMENIDLNNIQYLNDYTDLKGITIGDLGPNAVLHSDDPARLAQVYKDLKSKGKNFKVYRREELPKRFRISKNKRAGDIIVLPKAPFSMGIRDPKFSLPKGHHGYDPQTTPSMHGIFYANGPQVRKTKIPAFESVHIAPMVLKILGLPQPKMDGELRVLKPILK